MYLHICRVFCEKIADGRHCCLTNLIQVCALISAHVMNLTANTPYPVLLVPLNGAQSGVFRPRRLDSAARALFPPVPLLAALPSHGAATEQFSIDASVGVRSRLPNPGTSFAGCLATHNNEFTSRMRSWAWPTHMSFQ